MLLRDSQKLKTILRNKSDNEQKEIAAEIDAVSQPENRFYWDFRFAAAEYFYIIDKRKRKVKFKFNPLQKVLYKSIIEETPIRTFIIKARKFGISTFFLLLFYWDCITSENTSSIIIAEEFPQTKRMFRIPKIAHENLDEKFRPKTNLDNTREMMFGDINSYYYVGSAQKKNFGRADTVANLHCSEFAFWPNPEELLGAALSEAVPEETGNVVIETTPSMLPYLKELVDECKETEKPFRYKFFPWHIFPEYREKLNDESEKKAIAEELTKEESLAMKTHSLDWEQMKFWLTKRRKLKRKVWQEYPMDDISCFMSADDNVFFDTRSLQELYLILKSITPIAEKQNGIKIYNEPIPGKQYIIAADTSGGGINSTYSAATVIRFDNAEEVAELKKRITPPMFGQVLAELGYYYNTALLAVERNNHGHSVINTLANQLHYPNLYHHIDMDYTEWAKKVSKVGKVGKKVIAQGEIGWPTTGKTKPVMMDDLRDEVIDEKQMMIKSKIFIEECFGVKTQGDKIYSDGYMDTVIARAIAWQVRKRAIPASLQVNKKTEEQKIEAKSQTSRFLDNLDNFGTLNRSSANIRSIRHREDRKRRDNKAPWEI